MDKQHNVKSTLFSFLGYHVDSMGFERNHQYVPQETIDIEFNISVGVEVNTQERMAIVSLEADVFDNAIDQNYPFSIRVKISGGFQTEAEHTEQELANLGELNGTATLFPFLRSIIANLCVQANTPPVMLPLVNVYNLIQQQRNK
jgi:preprotein translocase subunit SecB